MLISKYSRNISSYKLRFIFNYTFSRTSNSFNVYYKECIYVAWEYLSIPPSPLSKVCVITRLHLYYMYLKCISEYPIICEYFIWSTHIFDALVYITVSFVMSFLFCQLFPSDKRCYEKSQIWTWLEHRLQSH